MERRRAQLEAEFKGMSAEEIDEISKNTGVQDEELVGLLDAGSCAVGDEVALLLVRKGRPEIVSEALLGRKLRRAIGRVRATWVLHQFGKNFEQAACAYLALLDDRSIDVLSNALFGLVFLGGREAVGNIRAEADRASGKRRELLERAVEALEKGEPRIYSPYFADSANVWGLRDKK